MIIVCQICLSEIAEADDLYLPLRGDMFKAHVGGFPDPFFPVGWKDMKCRYCGYRPFLKDDEVLTTDGIVKVVGRLVCECGKTYDDTQNGRTWFKKHKETCDVNT